MIPTWDPKLIEIIELNYHQEYATGLEKRINRAWLPYVR
jgi:hypothetical protein